MANNWAFILWIGIITVLCHATGQQYRRELVNGRYEQRLSLFWAFLMFLPVMMGAALRTVAEGDTGSYKNMFNQCPSSLSAAAAYLVDADRDKGYVLWEILFKSVFGNNFQLFIAINAVFCSIILVLVYRKYSCSLAVSFFLFVAGFEYYQWMYNGMRQFMAVCIALACTEDMVNRRYKKIIIPFLIAASLHMSVLIIVPCLLFVQGPALNHRTLLLALGLVVLGTVLGATGTLNDLIADLMQSTQYDSVLDEFYMTMDSGTNRLRVLVYLVPSALAFIGLRYIRQANDPVINFCANMSMVSSGIYIVSMFTSAVMVGRLPIYFSIYNYILLPWELKHMFNRRSEKQLTAMLVLCYMVYNYYQVVFVYGRSFDLGFLSFG